MFPKSNSIKLLLLILNIMLFGACSVSTTSQTEPTHTDSSNVTTVVAQSEPVGVQAEDSFALDESQPLELAPNVDVQTVASVLGHDDVFLLDVREQFEYDTGHIAGNTLISTGSIAERLAEIPTDKEVIVYCHSGSRSAQVTQFLTEQGYTNVHNMLGGIVAWQQAGLAVEQ